MPEPGEAEIDLMVEQVCAWAGRVGLLQRMVAIARLTGADDEDLYGVAEQEGFSRAELDALLIHPLGGDT